MKCGQIQKMLPACLDGNLSKTETALVENHLAACDSCRASFKEYQQARQRVKKLEEVEPPPGFAQKIMARIEQEEEKKTGLFRKLFYPLHIKVPIQAVAMVVVAVLAIQTYRSVESQKQTAPPDAITAVPGPKEEPARKEDRQQEAALPAKKTLPTSEEVCQSPCKRRRGKGGREGGVGRRRQEGQKGSENRGFCALPGSCLFAEGGGSRVGAAGGGSSLNRRKGASHSSRNGRKPH